MADEKKGRQQKSKKRAVDKWKKKTWFTILAPAEFERKILGETVSEKPETLEGRTISASLRDIANQIKKQHISIKFKIREIKGDKAYTEAVGHEIKGSYLKRMSRRRSSKIERVQVIRLKDGANARIKSVVITARKTTAKRKTAIGKILNEEVGRFISRLSSEKLVYEIVFGNIESRIFKEVKKVAPVKKIEIVKSSISRSK